MEQNQAAETTPTRPRRIRLHHPGRFRNVTIGLMIATMTVFGILVMVALAHTPKVNNNEVFNNTSTKGGDYTTTAVITVTAVTDQVPTVMVPDREESLVLPKVPEMNGMPVVTRGPISSDAASV
ncbi:hypothetical protein BDP81DRAFT_398176 [Colletotrichum phormii]|uniref:Uncharacterized protein n=1 Tax=Colletotrichum phormii TaxID=359342 RepID=A0AAJ0ECS0_9PEZI|nr:uncharacterized protein BDP81DRAFT_398176 [Colletotrichum phormii]KAK1624978.1 hypothetical protein BDP81DRAFT_398176 [Colletotrichum phormii]